MIEYIYIFIYKGYGSTSKTMAVETPPQPLPQQGIFLIYLNELNIYLF